MNKEEIMQIFRDTAYVRLGGRPGEEQAARYLCGRLEAMGLQPEIMEFPVDVSEIREALLLADGQELPCKGYFNSGSGEVEAPLYYLRTLDDYSLRQCKGKVVLVDGALRYWTYRDMIANGAVGFVTHTGHVNYADEDIDQRELRSYIHEGTPILGVNVNTKTAVDMVARGVEKVKIVLQQDETMGTSRNVILDLPGETDEVIVFTAHYDSTSLSQGAYDNMSGAIGLLALAEHFRKVPHRFSLRFLWCGSEERGLLGSKAYCAQRKEELSKIVLNINLDMIGCIMGKFISAVTAEERLCHYVEYLAAEEGFGIEVRQDIYSSDSTPFADKGVPALSFARIAPMNTATIHDRYDTMAVMKGEQMEADIAFLTTFADRMANAKQCPVKREIPEKMRDKLDKYLCRKRA